MSSSPTAPRPRPFLLACPDLAAERVGNTDTPGVWHFDTGVPGKRVILSALIHGNELCGAWALKDALAAGLRPRRGSLTLAFCNLAAFDRFDPANYAPARFVDEDMNRVWSDDKLAQPISQERRRAAALRPWVAQADWLLDFHSMSNSDVPLQLTGLEQRNIDLALSLGNPATIIADAGHAAGVRMRDYGRFGLPDDQAGDTRSLLIECGFHGDPASLKVAQDQCVRFIEQSGVISAAVLAQQLPGWRLPDAPRQWALEVTQPVVARSAAFRFVEPFTGLECIEKQGTVIGDNDGEPVLTPYDDCVLVMPSTRQAQNGVTVVRYARRTLL